MCIEYLFKKLVLKQKSIYWFLAERVSELLVLPIPVLSPDDDYDDDNDDDDDDANRNDEYDDDDDDDNGNKDDDDNDLCLP